MKKILWSILGGVALLGVGVIILGYALGGSMGTMDVEGTRLVYYTYRDGETYDVASAPSWMQRLKNRDWAGYEGYWDDVWNSLEDDLNGMEADIDAAIEKWEQKWNEKWNDSWDYDDYDNWADTYYDDVELGGLLEGATNMPTRQNNGAVEALPFGRQEYLNVSIDLGLGYVTIVEGDTATIQVDGPLGYKVAGNEVDGYTIKPEGSLNGVTTKQVDGYTHFFRNGADVTTYYTITLPKNLYQLHVEMSMGRMELRLPTLQNLEAVNNMAGMSVLETNAEFVELECNMGNIYFNGRVNEILEAECSMGNIEINLPRAEYSYDVASSMGVVSVNGVVKRNGSGEYGGTDGYLVLDCSMGNISVLYN